MHLRRDALVMTDDPRDNGNGPWYARLASAVLRQGGPVALLAVGFAVFLMFVVWSDLRALSASIDGVDGRIATAEKTMGVFASEQREYDRVRQGLLERQLAIMRQVCVNSAKTEAAMENCLR